MTRPMQLVREGARRVLLNAAGYKVEIEGEFPKSTPDDRYMVALYPHGEHANSILIPQSEDITYMAAHDHFYKNLINPLALMAWLTASTIPVVRKKEDQGPSAYKDLIARVEKAFNRSQKVAIYPQGTRSGATDTPEELAVAFSKNMGVGNLSARFGASTLPVAIRYVLASEDYSPQKGGPSAERRLIQRLQGKDVGTVTAQVIVGEPIPPLADRKNADKYVYRLAFILWGMVHSGSEVQKPVISPYRDPDENLLNEFSLSNR